MKCEIDYRKGEGPNPPYCFLRLRPESVEESGKMDTILELFKEECRLLKVVNWDDTHFLVKLEHRGLGTKDDI